jgi:hypothetical protein
LYLGWEAFNALIKSLYHRHTQKGGYTSGGASQSHLKGVIRFLFRELLFRTGDGEHFFTNVKYPGKDPEFYSRGVPAPAAAPAQSEPIMTQAMLETREAGEISMANSGLHGWEMTEENDTTCFNVGSTAAV